MDVTMRVETSRPLTDEEAELFFDAIAELEIKDVVLVEPNGGKGDEQVT